MTEKKYEIELSEFPGQKFEFVKPKKKQQAIYLDHPDMGRAMLTNLSLTSSGGRIKCACDWLDKDTSVDICYFDILLSREVG